MASPEASFTTNVNKALCHTAYQSSQVGVKQQDFAFQYCFVNWQAQWAHQKPQCHKDTLQGIQ